MVQDLVTQFGSRFTLGLYHTPNLRGILKTVGPERFNEVMGLQHMKIYLFDDDIFLSGYVFVCQQTFLYSSIM